MLTIFCLETTLFADSPVFRKCAPVDDIDKLKCKIPPIDLAVAIVAMRNVHSRGQDTVAAA